MRRASFKLAKLRFGGWQIACYGFVHYEAEEAAKHAIKRPDLKSIVAGRASIAARAERLRQLYGQSGRDSARLWHAADASADAFLDCCRRDSIIVAAEMWQPAKAAPIVDLTGPGALAQVHVWPAGTGFVPTADLPLTDEEDEEEEKAFHQWLDELVLHLWQEDGEEEEDSASSEVSDGLWDDYTQEEWLVEHTH
eukprot:s1332_g4.t1